MFFKKSTLARAQRGSVESKETRWARWRRETRDPEQEDLEVPGADESHRGRKGVPGSPAAAGRPAPRDRSQGRAQDGPRHQVAGGHTGGAPAEAPNIKAEAL